VGLSQPQVQAEPKELSEFPSLEKPIKVLPDFADQGIEVPLYDIWKFKEKSQALEHYRNSESALRMLIGPA
jgi:hypothetical protein